MSTTLVRHGTIVTAPARHEADICVDDGTIMLIGRNLPLSADTVVAATGALALPGGIDVHCVTQG